MLALTMGDPGGIGAEITAKAWQALRYTQTSFVYIGDPVWFASLYPDIPLHQVNDRLEGAREIFAEALPCLAISLKKPVQLGVASSDNAQTIIQSIERATQLALQGIVSGVVTNPISKSALAQAGFTFPGHTEFLAHLCGVEGQEIMMMAGPTLKVVLTTVHVPLKQAVAAINQPHIVEIGRKTLQALKTDFGIAQPRLAVAGLNPHAGENGKMGEEEEQIIIPSIHQLKAESYHVTGPYPPDSLFIPHMRTQYDAVLCHYHDQGLIPFKTLEMDQGVNVTLGLPIVRTSPDHGTAFDIAGKGQANEESLICAVRQADFIATCRKNSLSSYKFKT